MTDTRKTSVLTRKRMQFVHEYLKDLNATQAAIRAGFSPKTARSQGHRLLTFVDIQNEIEKVNKQRLEQTKFDADTLLVELVDENRADLADLYDENQNLKPVHDWPLVWRRGLIAGIEVEELFEGRGEERQHIGFIRKLKISDRLRRKELIGKHVAVQAFKERVEHDVSDPLKELMREIGGQSIRPPDEGGK